MKNRRCKNVRAHTSSRGWSYLVDAPRKGGQLVPVFGTVFFLPWFLLFFCKTDTKNCEIHLSQVFFFNYRSFISRHRSHFRLLSPHWKRLDSVPKPVNKANAHLAWISATYSVRTLLQIERMPDKIQTITHPDTKQIELEQRSGEICFERNTTHLYGWPVCPSFKKIDLHLAKP